MKSKTDGCLVLRKDKSSIKQIEFQFSCILLKLGKKRVVADAQ